MFAKVQNIHFVTFVGVPGSGKTATVRHIALKLQEEEGYEILPIRCINDIETYCHPRIPQVFVIDDVIGKYGLDMTMFSVLMGYKDKIKNPLMSKTKILMTCRKIVSKNEALSNSFLLKEKNTILLNSAENELSEGDKYNLLKSYGLKENILPPEKLAITSDMFPYLCKLFSRKQKFRDYGSHFFISPVPCLLKELKNMKFTNKIHYGTLVLLVANQNELSKSMFEDETQTHRSFNKMKQKVLPCCKVDSSTAGFHFIDALTEMEGIYTTKQCDDCDRSCDCEFTFLHESMFEITAYHFGQNSPEMILKYMSYDYIANKTKIKQQDQNDSADEKPNTSDVGKELTDLYISVPKSQYDLLAKRLWRDIKKGKLYEVFGDEALKQLPVLQTFIEFMRKKEYNEIHSVFLSNLTITSKVCIHNLMYSEHNSTELEIKPFDIYDSILSLLNDEATGMIDKMKVGCTEKSVRAISWVVYFGHHQILKYIIDRIIKEKNNVDDLFQTSYNKNQRHADSDQCGTVTKIEGAVESVTVEQSRLLCLCCASGDLDTVKTLLKHVEKKTINSRIPRHQYSEHWEIMPLAIACCFGVPSIVSELLNAGANINQTSSAQPPLIAACKSGNSTVIEMLVKRGANVNLKFNDDTPLTCSVKRLDVKAVFELLNNGADVNWGTLSGTPLTIACREGKLNIHVVEVLLWYGADVNVSFAGHTGVAVKLISLGIDVTKNDFGKTSLIAACAQGQLDLAEKIITERADVNLVDGEKTPLIVACYFERLNVVKRLIKAGADVNLGNGFITPLQVACFKGYLSIVLELIKEGAEVNLKYKEVTALAVACFVGQLDVVKKLIELGADVNKKSYSRDPIRLAWDNSHFLEGAALLKAGAIYDTSYLFRQ